MRELNCLVSSLIKRNRTLSKGDVARAVRLLSLDRESFDRVSTLSDTSILWEAALASSGLRNPLYEEFCWLIDRVNARHDR